MDKVKVGIPRALNYYHFGYLWINFFDSLEVDVVVSPPTNKEMLKEGGKYASDEMCLSLRTYLGHVNYLKDKCDYILIPRIDNYGADNQTCTNFLSLYDLVNNLFNVNILDYNISHHYGESELYGFIKIGKELGKNRFEVIKAYNYALTKMIKYKKRKILKNMASLNSDKIKILLVGHSYNLYDACFGLPILYYLENFNVEVIMSDGFEEKITNKLSKYFSKSLYWKYNKEAIGSIKLVQDKIDGIIFLTSFPCGPDSLVNELVMRKLTIPYINLIIDDMDSLTGIETRIESFVDIIEQKKQRVA